MSKMKDYQIETLEDIRACGNKLDGKSDEWLVDNYSRWSEMTFSAGWICKGAKMFYKWATTAPMDIADEESNQDQ
jgi:hypothetical protein